ncbi:hypothetical protein GQ42DRAFT_153840 [Ramicandelaber brevisporus]|nr:hypothetical protein GQ42DRAFT_153840 [Ramicandelaber brevisporus]
MKGIFYSLVIAVVSSCVSSVVGLPSCCTVTPSSGMKTYFGCRRSCLFGRECQIPSCGVVSELQKDLVACSKSGRCPSTNDSSDFIVACRGITKATKCGDWDYFMSEGYPLPFLPS